MQDILRLLTLWFSYGGHDLVSNFFSKGREDIAIDTWLDVIPQIIARIQTPLTNLRRDLNRLLKEVGVRHPQALIYPLAVASQSPSPSRRSAAKTIMNYMKRHSPLIVAQVRFGNLWNLGRS